MTTDEKRITCFGCGAIVPDTEGPTHPYIGSVSGCWALYGEVLGREYGEFSYPEVHRICVDTYAVQHPRPGSGSSGGAGNMEKPSEELNRKAIQSVAVHLVAIYLTLERGLNAQQALDAIRRLVAAEKSYQELEPPSFADCLTIVHVARPPTLDVEVHSKRVRAWAGSVWQAWSPHHDTVRRWAEVK